MSELAVQELQGDGLKYAISGQVAVGDELLLPSARTIIQFESMYNYLELPKDMYANFLVLLAAEGVTRRIPHRLGFSAGD